MNRFFTRFSALTTLFLLPLNQALAYNMGAHYETVNKYFQAQGFFYGIGACLMGYALYLLISGVKQKELKSMRFRIVLLSYIGVSAIGLGVMYGHMAENHSPSCPASKGLFAPLC